MSLRERMVYIVSRSIAVVCVVGALATLAHPATTHALRLHYTLDSANYLAASTSAEVRDVSGNHRHADAGSGIGSGDFTTGAVGEALNFSGTNTNDYLRVASSSLGDSATITLSAWWNPNETLSGTADYFQSLLDDGTHNIFFDKTDGKLKYTMAASGTPTFTDVGGVGLNDVVFALAVYQGELYVGGSFTDAGGNPNADYIARFDGTDWHSVGGVGLSNTVLALAVYQGELYVGGNFTDAASITGADRIARFDGTDWHSVGGVGLSSTVYALAVYQGELYVGGAFTNAAGITSANRIARFDGTDWHSVGGVGLNSFVLALAVYQGELYVGGRFTNAAGITGANNIARITTGTPIVLESTATSWSGWQHVAVTYDQSLAALYINGVAVATTSATTTPAPRRDLLIGKRYGSRGSSYGDGLDEELVAGQLDDIRLYDRALTASEITLLYELGVPTSAGGVTVSSDTPQTFYVGQATTTLATTTITVTDDMTVTAASDLRLHIPTSTLPLRFDTNVAEIVLGGSATTTAKLSPSVTYENDGATVVIAVTEDLITGDMFTVSGLQVGSFTGVTPLPAVLELYVGGAVSGAPAAVDANVIAVVGRLDVAQHSQGQVANTFSFMNKTNEPLLRFQLQAGGEALTLPGLTIDVSDIELITESNITTLGLYRDEFVTGVVNAGDELISAGTLTIDGAIGTITFSDTFTVTGNENFIVAANLNAIPRSGRVVLTLNPATLTATGTVTELPLPTFGITPIATHIRAGSSGSASRFGTPPRTGAVPIASDPPQTGGGSGLPGHTAPPSGGDGVLLPSGFQVPSTTHAPHNDWTNPLAVATSTNTYATVASAGARQAYGTFGFIVPSTDQITGITVIIEAAADSPGGRIGVALSWNEGVSTTTTLYTPTLTTTDTSYTLGGSQQLWGRVWSVADFSDTNFQVLVIADPAGNELRIDLLGTRVHSQATGGGGGLPGRN